MCWCSWTIAHGIIWDLFQYLSWDICPRWYHMGLLSVRVYPFIMGLFSNRLIGLLHCLMEILSNMVYGTPKIGLFSVHTNPSKLYDYCLSILLNLFQYCKTLFITDLFEFVTLKRKCWMGGMLSAFRKSLQEENISISY